MPLLSLFRASLAVGLAVAAGAGCSQDPSAAGAAASVARPSDERTGSPSDEPTASPTASRTTPASPPSPAMPAATPVPRPVVQAGDGRLAVVPGSSRPSGSGAPTSYVVEVEGGLGVDAVAFGREVDRVLSDPRSWGAGGRRAVRRVDGGDVTFRVALVSPSTADRLCAPLRTNGYFSCGSGDRAVLNVARWLTGARAYDGDLATYRVYLVNHEVGHTLGHSHASCPGRGRPAPVMLQQTKGLAGCAPNSWPYP